jgi:LysM repeat protein
MTMMLGGNRNGLPNVLFGTLSRSRIVLVLAVLVMDSSLAQQDYNLTQGYQCSGEKNSCSTYALYKTVDISQSIAKVGWYFDADPWSIADLSGLKQTDMYSLLPAQQHMYIPLDCTCVNATMQKHVKHTILAGDTLSLLSITPYGNLTTYEAMEIANPTLVPTYLQIRQVIKVPIFCACPTTLQANNYGTNILLTYVVEEGDTLVRISNYFNITLAELCAANKLQLNFTGLVAHTTLLVPLQELPALSSIAFASIDPTVPTPGTSAHSTRIIKIAAILGGILFIVVVLTAFLIFYKKRNLSSRRLDHNLQCQLRESTNVEVKKIPSPFCCYTKSVQFFVDRTY